MKYRCFLALLALLCGGVAQAQQDSVQVKKWKVGDTEREALVYVPQTARNRPSPVLFVFHGHGGNMQEMFHAHNFSALWPEAIIIVPQGLKTPGQLVDHAGNFSGWQQTPGNQGDRDIHFFDDMLNSLKKDYQLDDKRIYATGHSNGGSFTYLLWAVRGDVFAALAPSAAVAFAYKGKLKPKPVVAIMGKTDPLVKPAWQALNFKGLLALNSCSTQGQPYADYATFYDSSDHTPVIGYIHPGGHVYPKEADAVVINFFKSTVKP